MLRFYALESNILSPQHTSVENCSMIDLVVMHCCQKTIQIYAYFVVDFFNDVHIRFTDAKHKKCLLKFVCRKERFLSRVSLHWKKFSEL